MADLEKPDFDTSVENFYYNNQMRTIATQFMAIFSGLQVSVGKNDFDASSDLIEVPIRYATTDRVVAAIKAGNTQNKLIQAPALAARIVDMAYAPERNKGAGTRDRRTFLPRGASMPDELKVIHRYTPVPYDVTFELAILTSNLDQQWQIIEQITRLVNPILQLQTSDDSFDWTKIHMIEIGTINLEENYPLGTDRRLMTATISFTTTVLMSLPANIKQDYIKKVMLRLAVIPTPENPHVVVKEIERAFPQYEKLFDIADYDIPPQ